MRVYRRQPIQQEKLDFSGPPDRLLTDVVTSGRTEPHEIAL